MSDITDIFEGNSEEWLDALPTYQKNIVTDLLHAHSPELAANVWLEATIENNSPFSSVPSEDKKKYFNFLMDEIQKLLCGNPEYDNQRNEILELFNKNDSKAVIVSFISTFIGANFGLSAVFIAPVIVIILMIIGKTSLNAWCTMQREKLV
ncbi:hypothetical protein BSK66_32355 [Paenibacillus odorifer]|uniref:Uncharacterized protein n=1 Tax=Paenibacillus odorifer TaxID=189426 RepID=A0A1R0X0Q9_9BACL|nr:MULTISPECIES: hypothetical protein [Paenibacillus]ETT55440.1 hypothetical protein C171_19332 [Paenibacillus sp. FSL H8-237]OMD25489.1 hypothetical protein BJP51_04370 [Paenibacillus odorifer]OME46096.1 hypothetical protein BSK66_32355 [Paenibacillus odorifer]